MTGSALNAVDAAVLDVSHQCCLVGKGPLLRRCCMNADYIISVSRDFAERPPLALVK